MPPARRCCFGRSLHQVSREVAASGGDVDAEMAAAEQALVGLERPLKVVQARLGHASIQMTADVYGHLFPRGDDSAEMAAAEKAFLGG